MKTLKRLFMFVLLATFAISCTDLELDELQEKAPIEVQDGGGEGTCLGKDC